MRVVNSTVACWTEPSVNIVVHELPGAQTYGRFPGGRVKFNGYTAMFFGTGKINVLGLRNLDHIDDMLLELAAYLACAGYNVQVKGVLRNVVVSSNLKRRINLTDMYYRLKGFGVKCMLELEMYPALRAWHGWSALIYHTGTIIVTGAHTPSVAKEACMWLGAIVSIA